MDTSPRDQFLVHAQDDEQVELLVVQERLALGHDDDMLASAMMRSQKLTVGWLLHSPGERGNVTLLAAVYDVDQRREGEQMASFFDLHVLASMLSCPPSLPRRHTGRRPQRPVVVSAASRRSRGLVLLHLPGSDNRLGMCLIECASTPAVLHEPLRLCWIKRSSEQTVPSFAW